MQQQIIIDVSPGTYVSPEIIEDAKNLEREVYFSRLISKSALTEFEQREYENFLDEFITEDDEPVDNVKSAKQQRLLVHSLYSSWKPKNEGGNIRKFFAEANIGLYSRLNPHISAVVPDVLVSLDVSISENVNESTIRSYMTWEFGKPPEIAIEIVSNVVGGELNSKMTKYAKIGVKYYVVFDPQENLFGDILQVYELENDQYHLRNDFDLPETGLCLTLWQGNFEGFADNWLRWLNTGGEMLLTADEKNARLAEKLRELGLNPNEL
jgi:Uma2 family endonuclease